MNRDVDFPLAIVKGLVEHGDGTAYFASLIGYQSHRAEAITRGLVTTDGQEERLTDAGRKAYQEHGLDRLPKRGRAYLWDWSGVERGAT